MRLVGATSRRRRRGTRAAALAAALATAGAPALAAEAAPEGFLSGVLETFDIKTRVGARPDFVEATHPDPATLRFIPTGTPHPKRPLGVKSPEDIEAAKAALDAARDAQLAPVSAPPKRKAAKPRQVKAGD